MKPIVLSYHSFYSKATASVKSQKTNPYEEIFTSIKTTFAEDRSKLEQIYAIYIGEFIRSYSTKPKKDISEPNSASKELQTARFNAASRAIWKQLATLGLKTKITPKDFAEHMFLRYEQYENAQDRLFKAPNGFGGLEIISKESEFLKIITQHAYTTTEFLPVYKIEKVLNEKGELTRPNQRVSANAQRVLPTAIFDIDKGLSIDRAERLLEQKNIAYAIVTSKSHTDEHHRFRVFIPLDFKKDENFQKNGFPLSPHKSDERKRQVLEYKHLQIEIAKELGIYEYCDPSPLGELARKYMPSPPSGAWNHRSSICFSKPLFEITLSVKKALQQIKEDGDNRKITASAVTSMQHGESLMEYAQKNIDKKIVINTEAIAAINPLEIVYHYELDGGNMPRLINPSSSNPRVKTEGHEYSIKTRSDGKYNIKDFVTGVSVTLLGYMRNRFPNETKFQLVKKLQKDFPLYFTASLITENPYFYAKALLDARSECSIHKSKTIREILAQKNIAEFIFIENDKLAVKKTNGFVVNFPISSSPKNNEVNRNNPLIQEALSKFALKKNSIENAPDVPARAPR